MSLWQIAIIRLASRSVNNFCEKTCDKSSHQSEAFGSKHMLSANQPLSQDLILDKTCSHSEATKIEYRETLSAVLGVSSTATEAEIRDAYRALVFRIHPDKVPDDGLRKLHTLLFQKVQSFYDDITTTRSSSSSDSALIASIQLPETHAALHARNIAAKEALKQERTRATDVKHATDARNAVKNAKLAARSEKLTGIRNSRVKAQEAQRQKKITKEAATKLKPKEGRSDGLVKATAVASGPETDVRSPEDLN